MLQAGRQRRRTGSAGSRAGARAQRRDGAAPRPGGPHLSPGRPAEYAGRAPMKLLRLAAALASLAALATSCAMDHAPQGLRRTPDGPGAKVRFDLAHKPLPDIPIPNDTATWPDPTSRTGLRVNASLIAPTNMERQARQRFDQMEGWGTYAPIWVSFDVDKSDPLYADYTGAALDLANIRRRHQGQDYDFADDAVYLVNLTTGVPVVLDLGSGNFDYTLKKLDKYWPNDTRASERNLLFDTIDESKGGLLGPGTFTPADDTDFDGVMDVPNLDDPKACPGPDLAGCDAPKSAVYGTDACLERRRSRDRCMADHLLDWYERETDTLILRPVIPLDEMTRYAVVITDRTIDGKGNAIKSPFDFVYHATMEATAARVRDVVNDPSKKSYFGDLAGTGLDHVAFTWSFTTQPTVDDMKRLRDGLYGQGPFARFASEWPTTFELERAVGLNAGLNQGATDLPDWKTSDFGKSAGCPGKAGNLYVIKYDDIKKDMKRLVVDGFGLDDGPGSELLLRSFDSIDKMLVGFYHSPFLIEGGPKSTDPNAAFDVNFQTGQGALTDDLVQFWLIIPKETAEFHQPFNVDVYGHGYTGNFSELLLYAGNMAKHGLATIGINAVNHQLTFDTQDSQLAAKAVLAGQCVAPFYDALTTGRARDLNGDGIPDSGGDFWSSYLFHTRDSVRQSVLDHIQLVRILRSFGTPTGKMLCRTDQTGWDKPGTTPCDVNADGKPEIAGDFDGDGRPDVGGPNATYGTWGESLGGILSGIYGSIDAYITSAVPGSGGGGLTDIGIRSFQGGVIEAVLLRLWGPLLVTVPAEERISCQKTNKDSDHCTVCQPGQMSLRWVMPDVNGTGELEIQCVDPASIDKTTVFAVNRANGEVRCARVDDEHRFRIGLPASIGDDVVVDFYAGRDAVTDYGSCAGTRSVDEQPKVHVESWGPGRYGQNSTNTLETETCTTHSCSIFQGHFFQEGTPLTSPAEGLGQIRQTPALRRFITLAQMALDPGDPINFAPYYSIKPMTDPFGAPIAPHALLTLNTIGDMNVPLNSGIAFGRASGALPFMRPDQAATYPEYSNYVTPRTVFDALGGRTPNQVLIDDHVIEGIAALARHPAAPECATSQNEVDPGGTYLTAAGQTKQCLPTGCTQATETDPDKQKHVCWYDTHCDVATSSCQANTLGKPSCDEALYDVDELDEGKQRYFEQSAPVPLRLARYTQPVQPGYPSDSVWAPRVNGVPYGPDGQWQADPKRRLTALLDAYIYTEGNHCFVNGEPCQSWDEGTYLTNLVARFFMSDGTDVYYLSHPKTHHCLATNDVASCGYLDTHH
jgi:hypothetical protein